jgi:hypothetical protein
VINQQITPVWQVPDDQGSAEPVAVDVPASSGEASGGGESPFTAVRYTGSDGKVRTLESQKQFDNHMSHLSTQSGKVADVSRREQELTQRSRDFDTRSNQQSSEMQKLRADLEAKNAKLGKLPSDFWGNVDQEIARGAGPQGVEDRLTQLLDDRLKPFTQFQEQQQQVQQQQEQRASADKLFDELATEMAGEHADFDRDHARSFVDELSSSSQEPGGLVRRLMTIAHEARSRPSAGTQEASQVKAAAEKARAKLATPGRGMAQGKGSGPAKDKRGKVSIESARQRAQLRADDVLA